MKKFIVGLALMMAASVGYCEDSVVTSCVKVDNIAGCHYVINEDFFKNNFQFEESLAHIIKNRPLSEFKYWEFLPSELKEMIADMLDFQAW